MPEEATHGVLCIAGREARQKIIQRDPAAKLQLAKGCKVSLQAAVNAPYGSLFQAEPGAQRLARLFSCRSLYDDGAVDTEGPEELNARDNSQLNPTGTAQALTQAAILELKGTQAAEDVIGSIVAGSATFSGKTALSQAKYIQKKRQKHCPLMTLQPPTPSLVCEAMRQKSLDAILGMRVDTLGQMMSYGNVNANARVLCVDTIKGLLTGTTLRRVGGDGTGHVIHLYSRRELRGQPGHLGSLWNMDLHATARTKLKSIPFDFLPLLAQAAGTDAAPADAAAETDGVSGAKPEADRAAAENGGAATHKAAGAPRLPGVPCSPEETRTLLAAGVDSVLVAARFPPLEVLTRVWPLLAGSGSFCVYCPVLEPLQTAYEVLRDGRHAVQLMVFDNWLREYQVLPNRTHPHVNMSATGGYLLAGIKVLTDHPLKAPATPASSHPHTPSPLEPTPPPGRPTDPMDQR